MNTDIQLVPLGNLKAHEQVSTRRVQTLIHELKRDQELREAILVARDSLIILDGHHRVAAFRRLGFSTIPAHIVDYLSDQVHVTLRRPHLMEELIKQGVIAHGLTGKLFRYKTTKHFFTKKIPGSPIPFTHLR